MRAATTRYSVLSYIQYYNATVQQYALCIYKSLLSANIIVFVIYCTNVINMQKDMINQINSLYRQLENANSQLQDYAVIAEKMAQTKEQLERISQVIREGLTDVRRSVSCLRPDSLERFSLEHAITKMVTDINPMSTAKVYFYSKVKNLKFDENEENAIYRVIQEGITNALRHGKADKIWINLDQVYEEILLQIKDNGIGCEEIKSGFGTKHMEERISLLGGTVEFNGKDGFEINARIPIRWGEKHMVKVLIADDQELIRQSLDIVLSNRENIEVIGAASNGQEVIQCVRRNRPGVILMDVCMPKIDGVQCTKIIKENYPEIKIIILTTFDDDEFVFNALKSQMDIFRYSQGVSVLKDVAGSQEAVDIIQKDMDEDDQAISSSLLCDVIENGIIKPRMPEYEQVVKLADAEIAKMLEQNKDIDSNMQILQRTVDSYLGR